MTESITQIINVPIIPVILLPVTGLLCLVFYGRTASMHSRLRALQKELRDIHLEQDSALTPRLKEMSQALYTEVLRLHRRSHRIGFALTCCLLSIFLFSLCALFVALGIYFTWTLKIALIFWFCGPILICIGITAGISELIWSIRSLATETQLITKWSQNDEE